eukprot:1184698-Prorocentrum_minimum.AAC.2
MQIFCLHGGLSPSMDTLDHIRGLDRVQEVSVSHHASPRPGVRALKTYPADAYPFPTRVPCAICCGLTLMTAAAGVFLREGLATPSVRCVLVASRFFQELWTSFKNVLRARLHINKGAVRPIPLPREETENMPTHGGSNQGAVIMRHFRLIMWHSPKAP